MTNLTFLHAETHKKKTLTSLTHCIYGFWRILGAKQMTSFMVLSWSQTDDTSGICRSQINKKF
jgi:hypothetical protein